jgi:SAM-dependent methyltransferase
MGKITLLRTLEQAEIARLELHGQVLDLGGDKHSAYYKLLRGKYNLTLANINPQSGAELIFDLEKKFPVENNQYDVILCFNVLEHIFNYQNVADESWRILKDGSRFIGVVPFMFHVHASPSDYFRYTKFSLIKILEKSGFKDIEVKELGGGFFSAIYQLQQPFYDLFLVGGFFMRFSIWLDKIVVDKMLHKLRPSNHLTAEYVPLGYFFTARK